MTTDYSADFVSFVRDLVPVEGSLRAAGRDTVSSFDVAVYRFPSAPLAIPAARNILDARTKKQGKSGNGGGCGAIHGNPAEIRRGRHRGGGSRSGKGSSAAGR